MVVTQLAELSASRSKVYIDDEFAFVLYKGELRNYKIAVGRILTQEEYDGIVKHLLAKRAKLRGMALLKSRPYTEKQMRDKLKQGYYPQMVIDEALQYLQSFHYIDDMQYAENYIQYHCDMKSRKRLETDLIRKGIDKSAIEKAFESWMKQGGGIDEVGQIKAWIRKKQYDVSTADRKEQQKMMAFLFRKGFSIDAIRYALKCEFDD